MTTTGESYVVRIYLRDAHDPELVSGVVQRTDVDQNYVFHTVTELLHLLALARPSSEQSSTARREDS